MGVVSIKSAICWGNLSRVRTSFRPIKAGYQVALSVPQNVINAHGTHMVPLISRCHTLVGILFFCGDSYSTVYLFMMGQHGKEYMACVIGTSFACGNVAGLVDHFARADAAPSFTSKCWHALLTWHTGSGWLYSTHDVYRSPSVKPRLPLYPEPRARVTIV